MERSYDEMRVPSRLAGIYTHFGWVRARNKVSDELDRLAGGIVLSRRDDEKKTELIRRRKRFGYNGELAALEQKTLKYGERKQKKGTVKCLRVFGVIFILLCVACLVFTFVPKIPKTVAETESNGGIGKIFTDIALSVNGLLFYGDQYYVKDSDVVKEAADEGTVVTVSGTLSVAYRIGEDGQLMNEDLETLREKIELDENGNIPILRCQKAYLDPSDESTAYYRYYIYYDTDKAPLGFLMGVVTMLPSIMASAFIIFALIALILAIVFFIIASCISKTNKVIASVPEMLEKADHIVAKMKEDDPSLLGKSQRHFYSWQKLLVGAINQSNVAKNDNSDGDAFGEDFEI